MTKIDQNPIISILNSPRFGQIIRFYIVGLINTAFSIALYFFLVYIGVNLFIAQAIGQVIGAIFNYYTYKRGVFRDADHARARFAVSYGINYVASLGFLAFFHIFIKSPYIAGILTVLVMSLLSYFLLKFGVFTKRKTTVL